MDLVQNVIDTTSFGIWDLLNKGVRSVWRAGAPTCTAEDAIALLGKLGVPSISLHDIDVGLDPWLVTDASALMRV